MDENDVKDMMAQLGGMTALSHADLPARIFATWATALKNIAESTTMLIENAASGEKTHLLEPGLSRLFKLMDFCIGRMEMVAATQPRRPSATEEDAS